MVMKMKQLCVLGRLLFFTLVFQTQHVAGYKDMSSLCPQSNITLEEGQELVRLSQENFSFLKEEGSFAICQLRIMPQPYNSRISLDSQGQIKNAKIVVVGFDPSDPDEFPLRYDKLSYYGLQFQRLALRVHALVYPGAVFNISFSLKRDFSCGQTLLWPTYLFQYIRSPNYPQPFQGGQSCRWQISGSRPYQIEVMDYDGSEVCEEHKLRIISIFGPMYGSLTGELSRVFDQKNSVCGPTKHQLVFAEEVFNHSYSLYTSSVLFYNNGNQENHRGFVLRFKRLGSVENALLGAERVPGLGNYTTDEVDNWCLPDVVLERGQEFHLSPENFTSSKASGRMVKCVMTVQSKYFVSTIEMKLKRSSTSRAQSFRYASYDPTDGTESLLDFRNIRPLHDYYFQRKAVKIDVDFFLLRYGPERDTGMFDLVFKLYEEPICGVENRAVLDFIDYVGSPNYPLPYPKEITCKWKFSSYGPFQFVLVNYDGEETCDDQYLHIKFGHNEKQQDLICGEAKNRTIKVEQAYGNSRDSHNFYTATVVFHKAHNGGNHTGFLLGYQQIFTDITERASTPTTSVGAKVIVAVVLSIMLLVFASVYVFVRCKRRRNVRQQEIETLQKSLIGKWLEHSFKERNINTFSEFLVGKIKLKSTTPSDTTTTDTAPDKPIISRTEFGISEEDVERRDCSIHKSPLSLTPSSKEPQYDVGSPAENI